MTIANLANRAGMSSTTSGTGDITLGAALGAVSPNVCSYIDFGTAGITNGQLVSYLILDVNGAFEVGRATYNSTGPQITGRTVSKSSNSNALISLSGNEQVFITALNEDIGNQVVLHIDAAQGLSVALQNQGRQNLSAQAAGDFAGMTNGILSAGASTGTVTVSVLTFSGSVPSATDPVFFFFRDNTLGTGDFTRIAVTSALTVVLGSTKTLGATSGAGLRIWIGAFNNAGTVQLAAMNCSDSNGIFCPQEAQKYTTAVPANATKTWYSTSAIGTAAPWRFIGFIEYLSLTTAGTWTTPDIVQLYGPGVKKPGDMIQFIQSSNATPTTLTNSTTQTQTASAQSITPTSNANPIEITAYGTLSQENSSATSFSFAQISRGSSPTLIGNRAVSFNNVGRIYAQTALYAFDFPNASVTYFVYLFASSATTSIAVWNTNGPPGTNAATIALKEFMG